MNNPSNKPSFPTTKSHLYNPTYRPKPRHNRNRSCCPCTTFIILILILLTAITTAAFLLVYHPHRPMFSLSSLKISHSNLNLTLTLTAQNPNKKLIYLYDPFTVSISSNDLSLGEGSLPGFIQGTKNTTLMTTTLTTTKDVNNEKKSLELNVLFDTRVKAKVGWLKSWKVRVRVYCGGVKVNRPAGKATTATAVIGDDKCKVDLRIKIWKWTI